MKMDNYEMRTVVKYTNIHRNKKGSLFWDAKATVLIGYLGKGHTLSGEYFITVLTQSKECVKEKGRKA